jgi:hypothetical protein
LKEASWMLFSWLESPLAYATTSCWLPHLAFIQPMFSHLKTSCYLTASPDLLPILNSAEYCCFILNYFTESSFVGHIAFLNCYLSYFFQIKKELD